MEEKEITNRPFFAKCVITEAITVLLIILTIVAIKFISPKMFKKLESWYKKNVLDDTTISEVIKEGGKYEI